jgi:hypothetical protein
MWLLPETTVHAQKLSHQAIGLRRWPETGRNGPGEPRSVPLTGFACSALARERSAQSAREKQHLRQ